MFKSVKSGFDFFNKKINYLIAPIYYIILLVAISFRNIVANAFINYNINNHITEKAIYYPVILNRIFGGYFWLGIVFFFLLIFIINLIYYNIIKTNSDFKNKSSFIEGVKKIFIISTILFSSGLLLLITFLLLLSYFNIFNLFLILFLVIVSIIIFSLIYLSIFHLGLKDMTIKESFNKSWKLFKNKFWHLLAVLIIINLVTAFITSVLALILEYVFNANQTITMVIGAFAITFSIFYMINSFSHYIKKNM